ncbi:dnaJ homolog subfamily C member 13-like isoform X1 [Lytechinus variegatus]|uniref:dnaJ homolog subfamily C member 13-like isoform X1 n=1 Tax=Lytechinus variegatus TaxID=7654 RepID=UPI001BB174DB|nr:dnaJ homolog subfamily C member 13-like isoform X1 [Lytechinus variegatus]
MAMRENKDVASYYTTKHSWRGKYKRVFSVGSHGVTTYNPSTMEVTNQWPYSDFYGIAPNTKAQLNNEFIITVRKGGKKGETMRFSTEHRADIISEALKFRSQFGGSKLGVEQRYNAYKHHWSDNRRSVVLEVTPCSIDQKDATSGKTICSYYYKDIEGFTQVTGYPGGFAIAHGGFSRLHLFATEQKDQLIKQATEFAANYTGVILRIRKEPISFEQFTNNRLGKYCGDEALTSLAEFGVQKWTPRHNEPQRRVLCLTETCIVERDPASYSVITVKPLCDIFAIIRSQDNPQMFFLEYVKGQIRKYTSTDRDNLIAGVLDGVRASGNRDVCVKMTFTNRGQRQQPLYVPVDEDVESHHLRFLAVPYNNNFDEAVMRFNNNISYSGLLHAVTQDGFFAENKEKLINGALTALLAHEGDPMTMQAEILESHLQALRRLVASKAGFGAFTTLPKFRERVGVRVVKALKRQDDGVTHAAIDMLCALMQPMHDDYELRTEQLNKSSLLSSKSFLENLLELFSQHVLRGTGALVIVSLLDFLTFGLCAPYSETTDGTLFDQLLELVAKQGRVLYRLFQHPSMTVVKGAGLVMKAIIEEGDAEIAAKMQELALAEGALPKHLHVAMFTGSSDTRMLTNRQLSRHLVGLWITGNPTAMALLKRILPAGLLATMDSEDKVPEKERDMIHIRDNLKMAQDQSGKSKSNLQWHQIENVLLHWRQRVGLQNKKQAKQDPNMKPIVLRKRRQRIKSEANWQLFYYQFNRDHAQPNLIWNYKTREELRQSLENEMRAFSVDKELGASHMISWNHNEFEVPYNCLSEEIKIGDYYLRLLLEADESDEEIAAIKESYEFFNDLYHRFLLTTKIPMKCMCLQAMAIVYGKCYEDIGAFNDTKYIVQMLDRSTDKQERDRIILFLNRLLNNIRNVRLLIDAGGIKVLVDLLTLAHLHVSRATVPTQTNVIEAAPDSMISTEKEWYYGNGPRERLGPYSFSEMKDLWDDGSLNAKTRCWAQGLEGWKPLHAIPQLKWCLLATGTPVMNESDLATLILNMLIKICDYFPSRDVDGAIIRPLPKPKRLLSEATNLPHIVQLLLTFDPILVEKVSVLLFNIIQDNPQLPRLYLSGVFFFIMMYTGANVLPLAWFLKYAHMRQAFRSDENKGSDIIQCSILGHILPEAMVHFLENHSAEKFAETYLGEFDTPEAIWSNEMRRMMIEKLAAHIADFSPRLRSNTRSLYQYCPIPVINYPQLEKELFVNIYYLKHLCDTTKFPDWPISDPVKLLKDILEEWKKEVEKKPPSMSVDEAYQTLKLSTGTGGHEESDIRKAYFRLAQKYHPDKNPEGRDMFEQVNKAYEFLCSKSSRLTEGPNPENIVLILRAQSILFERYKEVLEPYKYAGYPMLIKTIEMETNDDTLFSKSAPLLSAASELAFHTVNCSALNAEELRREHGIETLQDAFTRCVAVLNVSSKADDMAVKVCQHVIKCYAVAAQFEGCRDRITEIPAIIKDVCRALFYKNLPILCSVAAECVSAFSVDKYLQDHLQQAGVIWHLLVYLFQYDFTLYESGVEASEGSNLQQVANTLANLCFTALARLAGYQTGDKATPENPAIRKSLSALLTPYLANQLGTENPNQVLKILNSNTENPYLLWDNSTRTELVEFVKEQQQRKIRTGECDPLFGADFTFSAHAKELIVGDIFVRIFNDMPTFPLQDARGFTNCLLDYLGSQAQYLHSLMALTAKEVDTSQSSQQAERLKNCEMALDALAKVIKNNPGTEIQCNGHYKLLFSLLRLTGATQLQLLALEVIRNVTGNQDCVTNIGDSGVAGYLLLTLHSLPSGCLSVLETLFALVSHTKIVKEIVSKGGLIYLLDLFCNSTNSEVREKTAELLAKMQSDKLVGPRIRILCCKFLPTAFMDAMRDSSEASVVMFESVQENPELIWNEESREKISNLIVKMKNRHYKEQKDNPDVTWKLPEDFSISSQITDEVVIGGVYLRLFISQPSWVLRKPKEFLVELLEKFTELVGMAKPDGDTLEMVTTGVVCFFTAQPVMADQMPQLGHLPVITKCLQNKNDAIPKCGLMVIHSISNSDNCVRSLAQIECVGPILTAMKLRTDTTALACELLHRMFQKNHPELVEQALSCGLIPYLLSLLEDNLNNIENAAATKAQIVKSLKSMALCLEHGERINTLLDKSSVWATYKEQRHDLFLSDNQVSGYLTGPGVAGYLTQGTTSTVSTAPPPVDTTHDNQIK